MGLDSLRSVEDQSAESGDDHVEVEKPALPGSAYMDR
jgi:hypothetical protein